MVSDRSALCQGPSRVPLAATYISLLGEPPCANDMRGGLCHARKPKIKTSTQPALTDRANSGLRAPADGSIIMAADIQGATARTQTRAVLTIGGAQCIFKADQGPVSQAARLPLAVWSASGGAGPQPRTRCNLTPGISPIRRAVAVMKAKRRRGSGMRPDGCDSGAAAV
jgi:hypothetical protein